MQDVLARRINIVCGGDDSDSAGAIAVYFVTAGEMTQLRAVESFIAPAELEIMPVHVVDILLQTRHAASTS